jgi:hypothetical protein
MNGKRNIAIHDSKNVKKKSRLDNAKTVWFDGVSSMDMKRSSVELEKMKGKAISSSKLSFSSAPAVVATHASSTHLGSPVLGLFPRAERKQG